MKDDKVSVLGKFRRFVTDLASSCKDAGVAKLCARISPNIFSFNSSDDGTPLLAAVELEKETERYIAISAAIR